MDPPRRPVPLPAGRALGEGLARQPEAVGFLRHRPNQLPRLVLCPERFGQPSLQSTLAHSAHAGRRRSSSPRRPDHVSRAPCLRPAFIRTGSVGPLRGRSMNVGQPPGDEDVNHRGARRRALRHDDVALPRSPGSPRTAHASQSSNSSPTSISRTALGAPVGAAAGPMTHGCDLLADMKKPKQSSQSAGPRVLVWHWGHVNRSPDRVEAICRRRYEVDVEGNRPQACQGVAGWQTLTPRCGRRSPPRGGGTPARQGTWARTRPPRRAPGPCVR